MRSNISGSAKRALLVSGLMLVGGLGVAATPAHAQWCGGTTQVKVISGVLRIYDGNSYCHNLGIQDDGPSSIFVYDVAGSVVVGAGCTPKTVSGTSGATCPKSGYASILVQYIGGDDKVYDWRSAPNSAKALVVYLGAGADYFKAWWDSNNPTEVHGGFGNDVMVGGKEADKFYGEENDDSLTGYQTAGSQSPDILDGGSGNDQIFSKDQRADTVNCNTGTDSANIDTSDVVSGCETITY